MFLKLFSATSYSESFLYYFINTTYRIVPHCCSGYVGAPPDCQGVLMFVEYVRTFSTYHLVGKFCGEKVQ